MSKLQMRHPAACKRLEDVSTFGATASAGTSTSRPQAPISLVEPIS